MGAAYGTTKSAVGVASMGVMRPELVMKGGAPPNELARVRVRACWTWEPTKSWRWWPGDPVPSFHYAAAAPSCKEQGHGNPDASPGRETSLTAGSISDWIWVHQANRTTPRELLQGHHARGFFLLYSCCPSNPISIIHCRAAPPPDGLSAAVVHVVVPCRCRAGGGAKKTTASSSPPSMPSAASTTRRR